MITTDLVQAILSQYRLRTDGVHGLSHWARVLENGRRLADLTGADLAVVELFAVFHDACRHNDSHDPWHGPRGARLAADLRGAVYDLPDEDFNRLVQACSGHTLKIKDGDVTIQTCWDADRLDLLRVGTRPDVNKLNTPAARQPDILAWANQRAESWYVPVDVLAAWGVEPGSRPPYLENKAS